MTPEALSYARSKQVPDMRSGVRIDTNYGVLELGEQDSQAVAALVQMLLETKLNAMDAKSAMPAHNAAGFRLDSPVIGGHHERLPASGSPFEMPGLVLGADYERHPESQPAHAKFCAQCGGALSQPAAQPTPATDVKA